MSAGAEAIWTGTEVSAITIDHRDFLKRDLLFFLFHSEDAEHQGTGSISRTGFESRQLKCILNCQGSSMPYRDKKSGFITILLLVGGFFLIVGLYKAFFVGLAAMVSSEIGAGMLLCGFLIVGWFGFFYKPKK
jgi:hypothetical protein